jgi:hypothetical protein
MSLRPEKCPTRCEGTLLTLRNTFFRLTTLFLWKNNRGSRRTILLVCLFSLFVHCTNLFELSPYARRNKIIQFAARNKQFVLIHLDVTTDHDTAHRRYCAQPPLPMSKSDANWPCRDACLFTCLAFCTKPRFRLSQSAIGRQDHTELHDCFLTAVTLITLLQLCQAQLYRSHRVNNTL